MNFTFKLNFLIAFCSLLIEYYNCEDADKNKDYSWLNRDEDRHAKNPDWIDPYDMFESSKSRKEDLNLKPKLAEDQNLVKNAAPVLKSSWKNEISNCVYKPCPNVTEDTADSCNTTVLMLRLVNKYILKAKPYIVDSNAIIMKTSLKPSDIKIMEMFSQNPCKHIKELYDVLSDIYDLSYVELPEEKRWNYYSLMPKFSFLEDNFINILTGFIGLTLFYIYCKLGILRCLGSAFAFSLLWNWYLLYAKEIAKRNVVIMKDIPEHCRGAMNSNWYQRFWSYVTSFSSVIGNDDCLEYHMAENVHPLLKVSPITAFVDLTWKVVLQGMEPLSETFSLSLKNSLHGLPLHFQLLLIIFFALFFCFIILICCNYRFRIPFFMVIEPTPDSQQSRSWLNFSQRMLQRTGTSLFQERLTETDAPVINNVPKLAITNDKDLSFQSKKISKRKPKYHRSKSCHAKID